MASVSLTIEELKANLNYNPSTGLFTRLITRTFSATQGSLAGCKNKQGYIVIRLNNKLYQAHRLAWFYMTAEWPKEVDHKDTIRDNNKWENLRNSTHAQNKYNSKANKNNKSGEKGISLSNDIYRVYIRLPKGKKYLGSFKNLVEAKEAYRIEAEKLHGEFKHHSV